MAKDGGRERWDDGNMRGGGCHRDAESPLFAVWTHYNMKVRGIARYGRQASDPKRLRVGKIG